MHEATLMTALIRRILEAAEAEGGTRVTSVAVWLGALSHMSAAHFEEHFARASVGSIAEGARLQITVSSDEKDPNAQNVFIENVEVEI